MNLFRISEDLEISLDHVEAIIRFTEYDRPAPPNPMPSMHGDWHAEWARHTTAVEEWKATRVGTTKYRIVMQSKEQHISAKHPTRGFQDELA